jgi:Tfp pilus assembly protein PilF
LSARVRLPVWRSNNRHQTAATQSPKAVGLHSDLFYNLACCESLAGRTNDAVDHLQRAMTMSERFRAYARDDSDLDPIRAEPAFRELIDR